MSIAPDMTQATVPGQRPAGSSLQTTTPTLKSQIAWWTRAQFALIGVMVSLAALFYFAGYRPMTAHEKELLGQIVQMQQDLHTNQSQASRLPAVEADLRSLRTQLEGFRKLPQRPELGEFVNQITAISHETNMHNLSYTLTGAPHPHDQYTEQPVNLKFEGDFLSVFAFVDRVENLKRLTRISNIAVHSQDIKDGQVHVDMSMDLYYSEG